MAGGARGAGRGGAPPGHHARFVPRVAVPGPLPCGTADTPPCPAMDRPRTLERCAHGERLAGPDLHRTAVDGPAREALLGQRGVVAWFTGLSGAGKTTLARLVEIELHRRGRATYLLDGDRLRHGLNHDLGFGDADRTENIRRVAEVAQLMADAGLVVLCALISPFREDRRRARALMPPGRFLEIHVDAPLAVAEARDPKGLYRRARQGLVPRFTGVDSPYEAPESPELRVDTAATSPREAAGRVLAAVMAASAPDAGR